MASHSHGSATAQFSIVVPVSSGGETTETTGGRMLVRPNYVSQNAQSLVVTIGGVNGVSSTFDLTPSSDGCSQPGGSGTEISCTETIAAPVGSNELWTFNLYQDTGGTGALLALTDDTVSIQSGVANSLGTFTLNGVVGSYALSWQTAPAFAAGVAGTATLLLNVYDPSGATIIAPGYYVDSAGYPVTFSISSNIATFGAPYNDTSWSYSLSPASFGPAAGATATSNATTVSYGGLVMPASTITVTDSENVQSNGATVAVGSAYGSIGLFPEPGDCSPGVSYSPASGLSLPVGDSCELVFNETGWSAFGQLTSESDDCEYVATITPESANTWIFAPAPNSVREGTSCVAYVSGGLAPALKIPITITTV